MTRRWSEEEEALLRLLYPDRRVSMKTLIEKIGRSKGAIRSKAKSLGVKADWSGPRYKLTEDDLNCLHCGVKLTEENWTNAQRKKRYRICKVCNRAKVKKWEKENPEHVREYNRNYARKHHLGTTNGKIYGLNKRPYPEDSKCELCNKVRKRLMYHHWDDENPAAGLWLGIRCHNFAELVDAGSMEKYLELKKIAEEERPKPINPTTTTT